MLKKIATGLGSTGLSETIKVIGLIAFTVWIAYFLNFKGLGLYEDDYQHITPMLHQSWSFFPQVFTPFLNWFQGRPVSYSMIRLLSFFGDHLGGIRGIHAINFLLISGNAYLCYRVFRYLTPTRAAIAGALFFCLYPLDGAKLLLTNSIVFQSTLGFLLAATLTYLTGRKWIAYSLIIGSLLSYETAFMVFFGVPLLQLKKWDRALLKELVKHFLILTVIIAIVVIIRKITGEGGDSRINNLFKDYPFPVLAFRLLTSPLIGIWANLSSLVRVPYQSLLILIKGDRNWLIVLAYFFVSFVVLATLKDCPSYNKNVNSEELSDYTVNQSLPLRNNLFNKGIQHFLYPTPTRLILVGIILLVLSYILVFRDDYYPPSKWPYGRGSTGAHGGATFSCSVLFVGLYTTILSLWQKNHRKIVSTVLLSAYLALTVSYFFPIQLDFIKSWQYQRSFWSNVVKLCPDLDAGTMILVDLDTLPRTYYIMTYPWSSFLVLNYLFDFPPGFPRPFLFAKEGPSLWNNFEWRQNSLDVLEPPSSSNSVVKAQDPRQKKENLFWYSAEHFYLFDHGHIPLPSSNTIMLKAVDGQLTRLTGSILIGGKPFQLKNPPSTSVPKFSKATLYKYLIEDSSNKKAR